MNVAPSGAVIKRATSSQLLVRRRLAHLAWIGPALAFPLLMTPMPPPTLLPIDRRAERILSTALDEFAYRGFRAASEVRIARRAGVSLATLRRYFPDKAELFRETVRTAIVTAIAPGSDHGLAAPRAGLRDCTKHFLDAMAEPEKLALLRLSLSEFLQFPELAAFYQTEVLTPTVARLERALGAAPSVADRRALARIILASLITHAHWLAAPVPYAGILGPDVHAAREGTIDTIVGQFAEEKR